MQRKLLTAFVALMMLSALPLSVSADENEDIPTNAAATGIHDSLVAALAHADLVGALSGSGPFTVFAPTDQAFADAGIDLASFDTDAENATLVDILTYHVVTGSVMSTDLSDGLTTDALNGDKLSFGVGEEVKVNDAVVIQADVTASNGVIHVIDKVLMPPVDVYVSDGSMASPYFQFYTDSAGENSMSEIDISKNYKFQRLNNPSAHPFYIGDNGYNADSSSNMIIAGDGSSSSGISDDQTFTVFFRDGFTTDDALSYFCTVHSNMIDTFTLTAPVAAQDITEIASSTGVHDSLVAALAKANLVSALQADGPFTVFAPTDQAFTDAGIDLDTFNDDESIAALADILTYHVYVGAVESSAVTDGLTVTMLNGDDASFTVADGVVSIEGATVTTADVIASNGVIHVIDKVLMPPADLVDITAVAMSTGVHETLVAALVKADMVSNLQTPGPFTVFAPTDQAFADAGIDLDTFTTADEIGVLTDILLYHVYNGAVESSAVTDGLTVEMLNGDSASFTVADGVVSIEGATVTTADVMASNGVVHVIDKVLMPPADVVDETDDVTCDVTIGISSDGYGFSPAAVTIDVGQTVCWQWTDAGMGHNVKEVDGMKSTTYVDGGVYSGTAATTVDFHHTFTEDTIFYYACEPHISMDMFGKVTVGDGGVEPAYTDKEDKEDNNTPGFLGVTVILATLGAVLFARMRQEDEL